MTTTAVDKLMETIILAELPDEEMAELERRLDYYNTIIWKSKKDEDTDRRQEMADEERLEKEEVDKMIEEVYL